MKKILTILLVVVLTFTFSACGGTDDTTEKNKELSNNSEIEGTEAKLNNDSETNEDTPSADEEKQNLIDGMRPEFKEAMDSYEAFYDQYCDFMKKYAENPSDLTMIAESADMMSKAADVSEKFDAWDEEEMNDAELKYYVEVNSRVAQKLIEVS